ncbi:flagellar basal body-associated FliL family protein [Sinorhizobium mexicanum]|uniref:Flagellar protein FliL n=1 Tax=Sinorhizobium mexicanum TaxID=375549 RepID=A0A859QTM7_9HYPH|nr:flagellar basal body-associated FliL family protein [Sinorhizobium mexicanum]MBP1885949.1 flagellar FliL protein [Sinorhizobium mexicanum]QLL60608.1 flagellar basal body-associated FliL family protein [Sinorhizobium mexicanum]
MEEIDSAQSSKSKVMTIAALAILTVVAGGGGWLVGQFLAPPPATEKAEAVAEVAPNATGAEGVPKIATEANGVVQLEPITTNLAYPSENWVRLEVALQFNGIPDVALAEQIHQDIAAYLKTVSLQQIQGPRGFQYLRDDIQERVDLRSDGRVTNVMFRTFVIQ